ncbi:MAG: HEAT repeat domain-containing protein [Candidatus Aminicenantes bacterium]
MNYQQFSGKFKSLPPQETIKFIHKHLDTLKDKEKISFLLSTVKEKDFPSTVRGAAVELLSLTSHQDRIFLQECSQDPAKAVARAAKKALKELQKKEKKDRHLFQLTLKKIRATQEKQTRQKIIQGLARVPGSWVNEVLLEVLDDSSEEIRTFVVDQLGKREYFNLNRLYQKLIKTPWYVKSAVLKILGSRKSQFSINLIETAINDSNVEVRRSAAQALGEIGGREALLLLNKLAKDENRFVRRAAEQSLQKISSLKFS